MKQEKTKKSKLWLWIVIGLAVALIAVAGVVALVIGIIGGSNNDGPTGGRPDLYWNVDRAVYTTDAETGLSTRLPGEDGVYRIRFAYNGDLVELPIADKQLVNFIDTMDIMGLVKDSDGVVVDAVAAEDVATPVALNAYVQQVKDGMIIANSSIAMNGMRYQIEPTDLMQIYNVSPAAEVPGEIMEATDLQPMDTIWIYANDLEEVTHIYMTEYPQESAVYWRCTQMWNASEGTTSRVPDENGVYTIDFCCDGEIVTLKCKDKSIVATIDNKSPHSPYFGFTFDEEGYISGIIDSGIGIRGVVAAIRIEVQELDGRYFSGTQLISGDTGLSYSTTLPEDCPIYDGSSAAQREGRQGKPVDSLQMGDRVCVWTNAVGEPVLVYISNRLVDVPAYFNLTRKYDGTKKETTREKNAQGYYEFEMVETGKTGKKILKTKDKELASFIDAIACSIVGLRVENGIILNAYLDDDLFGWSTVYEGYVPQVQGMIVSVASFGNPDNPGNILMNMGYKAYDMTGKDVPYGTERKLQVGDMVTICRNVSLNGVVAYVVRKTVGGDTLYYNLDYQYNAATKETKRKPDAEGWYVFTLTHKGKTVQVKTKDKELANKMDASPRDDLVLSLRVKNGIVYELYDPAWAYAQSIYSGLRVSAIHGDGTYTIKATNGFEKTLKMASDCVIYNVSNVFDSHKGERIYSLKVGDMVVSLADYRSEVKHIYVRGRAVPNMYVNTQQLYDYSAKKTLRQPDADGWYWFDLAVNGEIKKFKTNKIEVASQVDSYSTPFGLRVKGDEILNATSADFVGSVRSLSVNGWDVISAGKSSVRLQYNKPGYSTTGSKQTLTLPSNVKIYDISPTAEKFGAPAKPKAGDRIMAYSDVDGKILYVFITFHETRVKGTVGYCEHCKKEVRWHPWAGEGWDAVDCHYYLAGDMTITRQSSVGNESRDYEVVLDMNGKKLTVQGARGFLAYMGDDLSFIDSVGGGEIYATGIDGGNGGTMLIGSGSTVNLYGGTLSFIDTDIEVFYGAVAHIQKDATLNMYGGTIKGGIANSKKNNVLGGNIYAKYGTFNMYGGVIEDGQALRDETLEPAVAAQGGNIYAIVSTINLYGGTIRNGYSNQHGGNIFLSSSTLNMEGGTIIGGESKYDGGNIYNQFAVVMNMSGGTIKNGTAGSYGNNIFQPNDSAVLNLSGGTIAGDVHITNCDTITLSGAPKITVGKVSGLSVPSTVKLTLGKLTSGAEIYVNANGVFTEESKDANAYHTAGYFKPATPRANIVVDDNKLALQGEIAWCDHCFQDVEWLEWPGKNLPESGHYFLAKDVRHIAQFSIAAGTDVVLDLYGNQFVSNNLRNFLVDGKLSIMDTQGGGEMVTTNSAATYGGIAMIGGNSEFNLYSGTLRMADEHNVYAEGGMLQLFGNATFNMFGGAVIGGEASARGGNVSIGSANATFNMYGGEIKGGKAPSGGDVYTIGTFNMEGGTIGDVFVDSTAKAVTVSGASNITTMNIAKGVLADISGLSTGAQIGVIADGIFTKDLTKPTDYLTYLTSLNPDMDIKVKGSALQAVLGQGHIDKANAIHTKAEKMTADNVFAAGGTVTAICPVCDKEVQWTELNTLGTQEISTNGHYYLSDNVTNSSYYYVSANICLHLNGKNITSAARAIYVENGCHLNIMGDGNVTGVSSKSGSTWWGTVDVVGSVDLYGGTYAATNEGSAIGVRGNKISNIVNMFEGAEVIRTDNAGIGVSLFDGGDFNMYGGKISGAGKNIVMDMGANMALDMILSIYGGVLETNSAVNGGNIYADGETATVNVYGGSITGGEVYVGSGIKALLISGEPKIEKLRLATGVKATLSDLSGAAEIGVIANGEFTETNADAQAYLDAGYVVPAAPDSSIRVENNVMIMDIVTEADRLNAIHTKAEKMTADNVFAAGGTVTAKCPVCDEEVQWTELNTLGTLAITTNGHYYLSDSVTNSSYYEISADVCLHLNGKNITSTGRAFYVSEKSVTVPYTLNIMGEGTITGVSNSASNGSALDVVGSVNLYGGTYVHGDNRPTISGRGRVGNTIKIYDGARILGSDTYEAPSIKVTVQDLYIYGGTISNGKGGNIDVSGSCDLYVYGGTITGGTAAKGGNIKASGSGATVTIEGGSITNGDVYIDATLKTVTVSGKPVISCLDLTSGKKLTLGAMVEGADITVNAADGAFTETNVKAAMYVGYFKAADKDFKLLVDNNTLALRDTVGTKGNKVHTEAEKMTADNVFAAGGTVTAKCPVCDEEVQWTELNTLGTLAITTNGHYYLSDSVTNSSYYEISADVCLHLNGKNITSTGRAFYVSEKSVTVPYTLNIMGEGTITGVSNGASNGSALDVVGSVNLYGGTYVHGDNRPTISGRGRVGNTIKIYDGAEILGSDTYEAPSIKVTIQDLYIYGGLISNGKGGNIDVSGSCDLYVYGGTITGGTAAKGGNIKASGSSATVTIGGGTITNGDVYIDATLKSVTVSGKPVISGLDLTSRKKLILDEMVDDADITVNAADGAFTETNAKAANYAGYFKAAVSGKTVKAENNTLVIANS